MADRIARKLLILGWDAADWKIVDGLFAQGALPNLKGLVGSGVRGDITSLDPKLSPLLWTSIATGKTADKHGILNFVEPDPSGAGLRVSSSTTRKTKALWNILGQSGLRTMVVGWYATHPAEPIRGVMVSNLFQEGVPSDAGEPWALAPGSVHPPALSARVAELRLHPAELTGDELLPLLPTLRGMDHRDPRVQKLAHLVAQCASVHNVATELLARREEWDCAMVFHEAIDVACHHFMQYHPPRMARVSETDFALFRHVVGGVYQLLDMMLGTLLSVAGPETTVILLSDHGFHSDHLRPRVQGATDGTHGAMDATWHRQLGVLAMAGPGIVRGGTVYGASLLDITPTALTLLGLPVGADMDGRVLVEAIDRPVQIERVFGWDDLEGEDGRHPPDLRVDPLEARDAMRQLAELGYIEKPPTTTEGAKEQIALYRRETAFNLGVVYMTTGRPGLAAPIFEGLCHEHPEDVRFVMNLAHTLYALGRHDRTVSLLEGLVSRRPDLPDALLLRGAALFAKGRTGEAALALEGAERQTPDRPDLLCTLADAYIHLERWEDAGRILSRACSIDPQDASVHHKRALLALGQKRFEEAVEHALRAVELRHFFPAAHYTLGVALTRMRDFDDAVKAFGATISMQPGMIDAHRYLASIFRHLGDRTGARAHRDAARRLMDAGGPGHAFPR